MAENSCAHQALPTQNELCIRLAESSVFLRVPSQDTASQLDPFFEPRPAVLRGLLVLKLAKPTRITSIDVTLTGKSTISWREGTPTRPLEITETNKFFKSEAELFKPKETTRRVASISPVRRTKTALSSGSDQSSTSIPISPSSTPSVSTPDSSLGPQHGIVTADNDGDHESHDDSRGRRRGIRTSLRSFFTKSDTRRDEDLKSRSGSDSSSVTTLSLARRIKNNEATQLFQAGTYTYPISFIIPPDLPPSMEVKCGKVAWELCGVVHRPGTFTNKLVAHRAVRVDRNALDGDGHIDPLTTVERQWEDELRYSIAFSAHRLYVGGTIPLSLALQPLEKVKIFGIAAHLEEKTEYFNKAQAVVRSHQCSLTLLSAAAKDHRSSLLPLVCDDVEAFKTSALFSAIEPTLASPEEASATASSLMGPGPWTVRTHLRIPDDCSNVQKSNMNKKAGIVVSHKLRIVIRVGHSSKIDPKTGEPLCFDIAVSKPIEILSCRCNPAWMGLPPYSDSTSPSEADRASNICPCNITRDGWRVRANSRQVGWQILPPLYEDEQGAPPVDTETMNLLFRHSALYQRLLDGSESVAGLAPPTYCEATEPNAIPV